MRKCYVILVMIVLLISGISVVALAEDNAEIRFLDLEWLSSSSVVEERVKEMFPGLDKLHREEAPSLLNSMSVNFSDPAGVVFPDYYVTDVVKTAWTEFTCTNYMNMESNRVAGWPLYSVKVKFAQTNSSYSKFFYSAEYMFSKNDETLMTVEEQFDDIEGKLIEKYGQPYRYTADLLSESIQRCSVWKGANGTGMVLKLTNYWSKGIYLTYGTTAVNESFQAFIDEAEKKAAQDKENELKRIQEDSSGL